MELALDVTSIFVVTRTVLCNIATDQSERHHFHHAISFGLSIVVP